MAQIELTKENSIKLILKKEYADQILAGTKTREYRDYTTCYIDRLTLKSKTPKEGFIMVKGEYVKEKLPDYIVFQVGYSQKQFVCECRGYGILDVGQMLKGMVSNEYAGEKWDRPADENFVLYKQNHKANPEMLKTLLQGEYDYDANYPSDTFIVFSLGKVLSKNY